MQGRKRQRGFTLVELLLVLVILAVLAAVVVPKLTGRSQEARITAAKADISNIETALEVFEKDTTRYPASEEGLQALVEPPAGIKGWKGPYLKRIPQDPWGNPYVYVNPGAHVKNGFDLYSYGPDGREGGGDDIDNWSGN